MIEKHWLEGGRENATAVKTGVDLISCFTHNADPTNRSQSRAVTSASSI